MSTISGIVKESVKKFNKDTTSMLNIIRDVQDKNGSVSQEAIVEIAKQLGVSQVAVQGVVSFYHFFSVEPLASYSIYLNKSAVATMMGRATIAKAFEAEVGCSFGKKSADGTIGLYDTSCIGMNDQEPAAIINGTVFAKLTPVKVKQLVADMKAGKTVEQMLTESGDGKNQSALIKAMVNNNIRKKGTVLFTDYVVGTSLKKIIAMDPVAVIDEVKASNLRGRGGAGFPTGMKWAFCREASGKKHYVMCNADEGEPGTFKDRVILTEMPELLFEGMAIAGYAVGAEEGILYLRAEYLYLKKYLEHVLEELQAKNMLGKNICGKKGFNFFITIKMGAGAYICGEESALIESAEGKRGEPRNRPPFPVQKGYLGYPTTVNNVETFCTVTKIIEKGSAWFMGFGTVQSRGTKLLSVSGDCANPGIYEVEWGITVQQLLEMSGGHNAQAVVVGGPSGNIIGKDGFNKKICYSELGTGGSIIIIGQDRDLLEIVHNFMEFFVEESCGWCVPCRAGNVILLHKLEKIMAGQASELDLQEAEEWCKIVKSMSRCGLGQTSPNPIQTTLNNFKHIYAAKVHTGNDYITQFDLGAAVVESCAVVGRNPNLKEH